MCIAYLGYDSWPHGGGINKHGMKSSDRPCRQGILEPLGSPAPLELLEPQGILEALEPVELMRPLRLLIPLESQRLLEPL